MTTTITTQISSKVVEKIIFPLAGHDFTLPYFPIITIEQNLRKEDIESARRKTWMSIRSFLERVFKS